MGDSKHISPSNWSSLSTVRSIDVDYGIGEHDIVTAHREIYKPSAKSLFIESLVDQWCALLEKDPHRRRRIYEVICAKLFEMKLVDETYKFDELASLRGCYQQALINLLRTPGPSLYKLTSNNFEWSRYLSEYEEVGFIAEGGFGKVYKAKHRLDQAFYAVKKIIVKCKHLSVLIMESNEVKTLAKLNHPNIVQYKAAWLEPVCNITNALPSVETHHTSSDSDEIVFQESNTSSSVDDLYPSVVKENEDLTLCKYNSEFTQNQQRKLLQINAILYVSMQLCDETLREWLDKRNSSRQPVDLTLCIDIMVQATKGLEYIHSCDIVHHDIKPSNIFLSNNLKSIQVGDFGLSCVQGHVHSSCPLEGGKYGTPLYAAPEAHKRQCNLKSDMYSLGLVFIELVSVFSTEMERVNVLMKSRAGHLPPSVPDKLVPIIKKLISPKVEKRPTSTELLEILYRFTDKPKKQKTTLSITKTQLISLSERNQVDSVSQTVESDTLVSDMSELLKKKENEIEELKLMLARRDDEIAKLKEQISSASA